MFTVVVGGGVDGRKVCGPAPDNMWVTSAMLGWRNRAGYARTDAVEIIDPISRRTMLGIAESYESLAQWTEQKLQELFRRGVGVR